MWEEALEEAPGCDDEALERALAEFRERYLLPRTKQLLPTMETLGLREVFDHIVSGGKSLRGFTAIVVAEALEGDADYAVDAAIATEIVQAASLTLDDIVDMDVERRGKPATWILYGVGKSALTSILLVPIALKMVEKYGPLALSYSIRAWEAMVEGEILDAYQSLKLKSNDYITLISLKTAPLFSLAAALGALAARREDKAEPAWSFGAALGEAYQVADDIVDYLSYVKGAKEKLDPSEELFAKWVTSKLGASTSDQVVSEALKYVEGRVASAEALASELTEGRGCCTLRLLPRFAVNSMLRLADLRV